MDNRTVTHSLSSLRFETADQNAVAAAVAEIVGNEAAQAVTRLLEKRQTGEQPVRRRLAESGRPRRDD